MPQVFTDNQGNRVIVRHRGPAGVGIPANGVPGRILQHVGPGPYDTIWAVPPSGTGAVVGPASAVDGTIPLYDGTTGKLIKGSAFTPASFATPASVVAKQDKVTGKGLSEADFSTDEKTKLANLSLATFRGVFASYSNPAALPNITGTTFSPSPQSGDWCVVEAIGVPSLAYNWDAINTVWQPQTPDAVAMTGQEIADVLFDADDSVIWNIDECRIYTQAEKAQLAAHEALVSSLGLGSAVKAYGGISYFDTTGVITTITTISNGLTNMVKVDVPTAVGGVVAGFDNGGASNGRLRYTGAVTKNFSITARVSVSAFAAETFVFGLAKNATIDQPSRMLAIPLSGITAVTLTAIVSLSVNDYLEVFVGNTTGTTDPQIYVLAIEALDI